MVRTIIEPDPHTDPRIKIGVVQIDEQRLVLTPAQFAIWDGLYRHLGGDFISLAAFEGAASAYANRVYVNWPASSRVFLCRLREKMSDQGIPFIIEHI